MTSTELNKLIIWLKEKGHTDSEIVNCLAYMTGNEKATNVNDNQSVK